MPVIIIIIIIVLVFATFYSKIWNFIERLANFLEIFYVIFLVV